ncbi:MAG: hypothetical protein ACHP7N_10435 [Caulobacterales bacterium]
MKAAKPVKDGAESFAFFTAKGQLLRVDFALEGLISLRHQTTAAFRVEPTVIQEATDDPVAARAFGRLTDDDLAQIDQATLNFGARLLDREGPSPVIILPVSFFTMAARRGRKALSQVCEDAELLKSNLMIEFVDVDRGTPVGRLTEVAGLVNSICRAVFIRVQPGKDMLSTVRGYRPHGLTVDASDLGAGDAQIAAQMLTFGEQARGAAPLLVVQGLPNDGFFQVAQVAGVTHASVRAQPAASSERSAA